MATGWGCYLSWLLWLLGEVAISVSCYGCYATVLVSCYDTGWGYYFSWLLWLLGEIAVLVGCSAVWAQSTHCAFTLGRTKNETGIRKKWETVFFLPMLIMRRLRIKKYCKSLNSRKSFVLGELSFARMPSRQYCLKVNKVHCWNWRPKLVNCGAVTAMRCGDPTWKDPNFGSPKIAPKSHSTTYMLKLDIFKITKFWAFHVGSPHLMAVTGCNELILANNFQTEFRSLSYNYNSKACWKKKVLPEQVIFKTFSKISYPNTGMKVRLNSLLYLPISDSWRFVNINPNP